MAQDNELALIESIYDALDDGQAERALELARVALRDLTDDDPVLRFLAGVSLAELGRAAESVEELRRAVELDPDDDEFRVELAMAFYRCCRFDEAAGHARKAASKKPALADAHHVCGLLLERRGRLGDADREFARAVEKDGDRFTTPCRVDQAEFGRRLQCARGRLPADFREHLERVGLIVEDLPDDALLFEESPPLDPELLGLFAGVPLEQQSYMSAGGELPPRIYLFKRNLERYAARVDELDEQIAITLYHELGHYLGLEEDDLEELEFG